MGKIIKYEKIISDYITGKDVDFSNIYTYGERYYILKVLKNYVQKHPESKESIEYIIEHYDELKQLKYTSNHLIDVLEYEYEHHSSRYIEVILHLLSTDINGSIEYLKLNHIDNLKNIIEKFTIKYPNQTEEIEHLNKILEAYTISKNNTPKPKKYINATSLYKLGTIDESDNKFISLYLSGYSIFEFCSLTGEEVSRINTIVKNNLEKNESVAKEILERKTSDALTKKLVSMAYDIDTNDEFDALDYHDITRLKYNDYRDFLLNTIDKDAAIRVTKKVCSKFKCSNSINKKNELNSKKIINGREITLEEKENIFNYLEEKKLPIGFYTLALKKYLKGNLKTK